MVNSEQNTQIVRLRQNAWYGDDLVELKFPAAWKIHLIQADPLPTLTSAQLLSALNAQIKSKSLKEFAKTSKKPIVLIDDLTRPTPIANMLPFVLAELNNAGIKNSDITILIACGTHDGITNEDIQKKLGGKFPEEIRVLVHDCRECELIGYTSTKTPIQTNRCILESDLRIGIGGIYPHPIAGFSCGGKLLALGAGGYDTIRILHDHKSGTQDRDCSIDHEFRREVNEITRAVGYDFSINLVLNAERGIAAVYCGDPEESFKIGVEFYKQHFSVWVRENVDIVISDMYPFDTDFQYAFNRGLWPVEELRKKTVKIIIASSPAGNSDHELFPIKNPLETRILRRLKYFTITDLYQLKLRFRALFRITNRRKLKVHVVSEYLNQSELDLSLPKSKIHRSWDELFENAKLIKCRDSSIKVAIYQTAPLLIQNIRTK